MALPTDPTMNMSYLVCSHDPNFKEAADEITVKLSSRNKHTQINTAPLGVFGMCYKLTEAVAKDKVDMPYQSAVFPQTQLITVQSSVH